MKTIRIAHRGASHAYPENTMLAYRHAIEIGTDYIECDVQVTRDGEIIMLHDETLDRTTNGTGFVHTLSLSHIRQLDAGRGEQVPLLRDVLQLARENHIRLCIELKGVDENAGAEIANVVIPFLQQENFIPHCVITSFYPAAILRAKTIEPRLATLLDPSPQDGTLTPRDICEQALAAHANLISYDFEHTTAEVTREAELTGLALWPWAPNTAAEISQMLALSVPGIMTDCPDILNKVLTHEPTL